MTAFSFSFVSEDIHSPTLKGFLWSHVGWFLFSEDNLETLWPVIPDLAKHSELVWLNDYYWVPVSVFTAGIFAVWGVPGFLWGVCVRYARIFRFASFCDYPNLFPPAQYCNPLAHHLLHQFTRTRSRLCPLQRPRHLQEQLVPRAHVDGRRLAQQSPRVQIKRKYGIFLVGARCYLLHLARARTTGSGLGPPTASVGGAWEDQGVRP